MNPLQIVASIANVIVLLYMLVLFARFVLDLVPMFSRDWRPRGFGLVLAEFVFTITDPPLRFLRKYIKPVRLGQVQLDLSFMILMIACLILSRITLNLAT